MMKGALAINFQFPTCRKSMDRARFFTHFIHLYEIPYSRKSSRDPIFAVKFNSEKISEKNNKSVKLACMGDACMQRRL